jgi:hypothetical protein
MAGGRWSPGRFHGNVSGLRQVGSRWQDECVGDRIQINMRFCQGLVCVHGFAGGREREQTGNGRELKHVG